MFAAIASLIGVGLLAAMPADPSKALMGSWSVHANAPYGYGTLLITSARDGKLAGTIFDQPLAGTFDAATGQVAFKRMLDANDKQGKQQFTGTLQQLDGKKPPQFVMEGTFRVTSDDETGDKPGVDYRWKATCLRLLTPAEDLEALQGAWNVGTIYKTFDKKPTYPAELHFYDGDANLTIEGNQLKAAGRVVATLDNDIRSEKLKKELGWESFRLLTLKLPDGKEVLCSYMISERGVEIAYPHSTSCHRGSGEIISLVRPAK